MEKKGKKEKKKRKKKKGGEGGGGRERERQIDGRGKSGIRMKERGGVNLFL